MHSSPNIVHCHTVSLRRNTFLGFWNNRVRKVATVIRTLDTVTRFCCGRSMVWHSESDLETCHLSRLFRGMCVQHVFFPDSVYRFGVDQLIADAHARGGKASKALPACCAKAMIATLRIGCSMSLAGRVRLRCDGELPSESLRGCLHCFREFLW